MFEHYKLLHESMLKDYEEVCKAYSRCDPDFCLKMGDYFCHELRGMLLLLSMGDVIDIKTYGSERDVTEKEFYDLKKRYGLFNDQVSDRPYAKEEYTKKAERSFYV